MLLGELARGVRVAWIGRDVLVHGPRRQRPPAARAHRLEPPRGQVLLVPGAGAHAAVLRAVVDALAVDHHGRRQDQPGDPAPRHRGEQHRGPERVDRHVVGEVLDVDAEADLGRLVHDGVGAVQGALDGVLVPHVTGSDVRAAAQVEAPHLVPGVAQQPGDVSPDETGRAGDHDLHPVTVTTAHLAESFKFLTGRPARMRAGFDGPAPPT
ncbi:hypothetical protein GCM10027612_57920 [Microbispora bryophytorum subsp. camponoti]